MSERGIGNVVKNRNHGNGDRRTARGMDTTRQTATGAAREPRSRHPLAYRAAALGLLYVLPTTSLLSAAPLPLSLIHI